MSIQGRPLPVADEQSAPFWEAAAEHILVLARCRQCAAWSLPPEAVCTRCGSIDAGFEFAPVSGAGFVRSWTVVRQSFLPGFDEDLPFVLVDVELADQPEVRLIGRLLDGVESQPELDEPVELAWEDLAPEVSVPAFRLLR